MASNEYHFVTYWQIPGTVDDVVNVLSDAPDLVRWWPSVYLDVRVVEPGEPSGLGQVVELHTRGWLPYTLRWRYRVFEIHPSGYSLEASGDFVGRGIWTFMQDGRDVMAIYDWKIRAEKPLLRNLSFVMKPLFGANHQWAMARGEESLKLELARRRAGSDEERAAVAAPPAPARAPKGPLLAAGLAVAAGLVWLLGRRRRS